MSSSVLKSQHVSLQFSDGPKQQEEDCYKLFAKGKAFPIKTGTESGPEKGNDNRKFLREFAREFNHRIVFAGDNFVAVDKKIIVPNSVRVHSHFVAPTSKVVGRGNDRAFPSISFRHVDDRIGRIAQAAVHYPTRGARKGDPNYEINVRYAKHIHRWMRVAGRRNALAFANGDFNMPDDETDWAFGENWLSIADELEGWKNTGHGPIDGGASYNKDGRVKAKRFQVLNDKNLHMNTDHFVCRMTWTIRHLKKK